MDNGTRCLVVDDEPRIRSALARLLEVVGYQCTQAASAEQALEILEREAFPLLLSDIRMAGMDGVGLLREVRRRWPDVAVLMLTAVAEVDPAVACLQAGAFDYIPKPFQVDEVRARVGQALEKRRLILENREYHQHLAEMVDQQALRIEELFLEGVQTLAHAYQAALGRAPTFGGQTPWMDSALLAEAGVETVVFGPGGAGAHAAEEWVDLESVFAVAAVLAQLVAEYCGR